MIYFLDILKRIIYVCMAFATIFTLGLLSWWLYDALLQYGLSHDALWFHCLGILVYIWGTYKSIGIILTRGQLPAGWQRIAAR